MSKTIFETPLLIENAQIMTPRGVISRGWIMSGEGVITRLGADDAPSLDGHTHINAAGLTLLPGFIDVHVHGALGYDVMHANPDEIMKLSEIYAQHGVTSFLATTWSDTREHTLAALENVRNCLETPTNGAEILGVHLEGPYLCPEMCGAQNKTLIRRAERDEALAFLDVGVIRLLSLAPEYSENHWLINECVRRGIVVSCAHTGATYEDMQHAIMYGLSHATHTYNAMTGLHHRKPGTLGAVMTAPEVRCELIADNVHVHPGAMKLLWQAKGDDGVMLITDSVSAAGMPDGQYMVDNHPVQVIGGVVQMDDGTLSGSTLTLERGLYNFMQATGESLERVWRSSSLNAARNLRIDDYKGSLEVKKDADFVLVDAEINVKLTIAGGRVVYRHPDFQD